MSSQKKIEEEPPTELARLRLAYERVRQAGMSRQTFENVRRLHGDEELLRIYARFAEGTDAEKRRP